MKTMTATVAKRAGGGQGVCREVAMDWIVATSRHTP
jgi:hypothetical protein